MSDRMSATAPARPAVEADAPLQRLLRLDAAATGAAGLLALVAPVSWWGDVPGLVPRVVGAVLLVAAAELLLASCWSGGRLRLAITVCADLALAWVAATVVVLALRDLPTAGTQALVLVGLVTLGFGVAELRALRRTGVSPEPADAPVSGTVRSSV
jgi:hypothetical protein